jgi:hypothetical protein
MAHQSERQSDLRENWGERQHEFTLKALKCNFRPLVEAERTPTSHNSCSVGDEKRWRLICRSAGLLTNSDCRARFVSARVLRVSPLPEPELMENGTAESVKIRPLMLQGLEALVFSWT